MDDKLFEVSDERAIELLCELRDQSAILACNHASLKLLEVAQALDKAIKLLKKEK